MHHLRISTLKMEVRGSSPLISLEEKHVFSISICDKILVAKDVLQLKSL
jgi:hypothetical protein